MQQTTQYHMKIHGVIKMKDKGWEKITENNVWEFTTKSILRCFYDVIATYEAHHEDHIPIDWLRDYVDNIAITFPRINAEQLMKKKDKDK